MQVPETHLPSPQLPYRFHLLTSLLHPHPLPQPNANHPVHPASPSRPHQHNPLPAPSQTPLLFQADAPHPHEDKTPRTSLMPSLPTACVTVFRRPRGALALESNDLCGFKQRDHIPLRFLCGRIRNTGENCRAATPVGRAGQGRPPNPPDPAYRHPLRATAYLRRRRRAGRPHAGGGGKAGRGRAGTEARPQHGEGTRRDGPERPCRPSPSPRRLPSVGPRAGRGGAGAHLQRGPARSVSRVRYCAPRSAVQAASRVLRVVLMRPPAREPVRDRRVTPRRAARLPPHIRPTCTARLVPDGDATQRRPPQQRRTRAARQPRAYHQHPRHGPPRPFRGRAPPRRLAPTERRAGEVARHAWTHAPMRAPTPAGAPVCAPCTQTRAHALTPAHTSSCTRSCAHPPCAAACARTRAPMRTPPAHTHARAHRHKPCWQPPRAPRTPQPRPPWWPLPAPPRAALAAAPPQQAGGSRQPLAARSAPALAPSSRGGVRVREG